MEAEHRLDQRGQPRGRPGVPDVAGRRGQGTRNSPSGQSAIARPSRVEVADARWIDVRLVERPAGRREASRSPVAKPDPPDDRVDLVAVPLGVREPFQDHDRRAVGQRLRGAQEPFGDRGPEVAGQVDRADECLVQLAPSEQAAGDVQRAETRRFLGRDGEARPSQAELAGDPAGDDAPERPHRPVGRERRPEGVAEVGHPRGQGLVRQPEPQPFVPLAGLVEERPADVEVGRVQVEPEPDEAPATEPGPVVPPRVGDRLGGQPEEQRLLREHLLQLARRDAESVGRQRDLVDPIGERKAEPLAPFRAHRRPHQWLGAVGSPAIDPPRTRSWKAWSPSKGPKCAARPTMAIGADGTASLPRSPSGKGEAG